jgi:hypothetical protein
VAPGLALRLERECFDSPAPTDEEHEVFIGSIVDEFRATGSSDLQRVSREHSIPLDRKDIQATPCKSDAGIRTQKRGQGVNRGGCKLIDCFIRNHLGCS